MKRRNRYRVRIRIYAGRARGALNSHEIFDEIKDAGILWSDNQSLLLRVAKFLNEQHSFKQAKKETSILLNPESSN